MSVGELVIMDETYMEQLGPLMTSCFGEVHSVDLLRRWFRIRKDELVFFGVKQAEQLVGYAIAAYNENGIRLIEGGVAPSHRHKGIGRANLLSIIRYFRLRGRSFIELVTRKSNVGARLFYEKLGFQRVGFVPDYYKEELGVLYTLELE